ncbi:sigma-54-dependent transcriptional regulator [Microbulbifer sp. 2201CG32-9]|uniref:sigma-54-dependent transcriptional regulator n=1 Tax=Microbulbifer sp. 2201CG32-9 TaxID=3232309 RepID=UPI00345BBEC3
MKKYNIEPNRTSKLRLWLHHIGEFPLQSRNALLEEFKRLGIVVEDSEKCGSLPGVLLFNQLDSEVQGFLKQMQTLYAPPILAVSVNANAVAGECSWTLLRSGAKDIFAWDSCRQAAQAIASRMKHWLEIEASLNTADVKARLRGRSRALLKVLYAATEAAGFSRTAVLISGETGTGKELLARMLHTLDPAPEARPFVVCDCTTIVPELSGSEFFGHERGAFTGAVRARDGAFAEADGGTLFLDEVAELPLRLQAELLRVIQEGTYKRVGSNQWLHTDFRLVCASHRDLKDEIKAGHFREDLYYRIAGCVLRMPSLGERREDIPCLVQAFLAETMTDETIPVLDSSVHDHLMQRPYPGNVRELRQLVLLMGQRYVPPGPITLGCLPETELSSITDGQPVDAEDVWEKAVHTTLTQGRGLAELRTIVADTAYRIVLREECGDTRRSARRLQVSQRAVQQYLRTQTALP